MHGFGAIGKGACSNYLYQRAGNKCKALGGSGDKRDELVGE
jgi:hypothetical protein